MHLSQKQKIFSQFFSALFESALSFEYFQTNTTLIAYVYPKLPTTKGKVTLSDMKSLKNFC